MIIKKWHDLLDMPKESEEWHKQDLADELRELKEAKGLKAKWSEISDIVYTHSRAKWSGHKLPWPLSKKEFWYGLLFMFAKYTSRWVFFYLLGRKLGAKEKITEVRNPKKTRKLRKIARKYGLDETEFEETAKTWLRWWPLLD